MQKSHGLFVPYQQHLVVDLETLFRYLHLVIFSYRECIQCGTERATVQAVQQHMTGKGHCRFDVAEEDSEFAEFYDFDHEAEDDEQSDDESDGDGRNREETGASSNRKPVLADEHSIRLPSGKIISRQSSPAQAGPSISRLRRRTSPTASQLEYTTVVESKEKLAQVSSNGEPNTGLPNSHALTKREKRERATIAHQLANMSANDRNSLIHLPTSQQRAILATQLRQTEKVQKEEKRLQTKIDRKGNKNLYAYWHTETPVYQCG